MVGSVMCEFQFQSLSLKLLKGYLLVLGVTILYHAVKHKRWLRQFDCMQPDKPLNDFHWHACGARDIRQACQLRIANP